MLKGFFSVTSYLSENTLLNYVLGAQLFPLPTRTSHNTPSLTYIKGIICWKIMIITIILLLINLSAVPNVTVDIRTTTQHGKDLGHMN